MANEAELRFLRNLNRATSNQIMCVVAKQNPPRFDEDVEMPLIKVVVLGASGVGKTALVKVVTMAHRKSQVRQCLGFCPADFLSTWPMNQLNINPNIA